MASRGGGRVHVIPTGNGRTLVVGWLVEPPAPCRTLRSATRFARGWYGQWGEVVIDRRDGGVRDRDSFVGIRRW